MVSASLLPLQPCRVESAEVEVRRTDARAGCGISAGVATERTWL